MADAKHIIKKAVVEVYIPSADSAFELQGKTLHFFKEKVCPLIEKIASKHSTDEIIRIDKLELDIREFNPDDFSDARLAVIEEQIEKQIMKLVAKEKQLDFSDEILPLVKKISKEKADEELFVYLLKTGSLPWWAKTEEKISLQTLAEKVLLNPSDSFKQELTKVLYSSDVRKRVAYKLTSESAEKIISIVYGSSANILKHIKQLVGFVKDSEISSEELRVSLYEYVFSYADISNSTFHVFVSEFVKEKNDFSLIEKLYKIANKTDVSTNLNKIDDVSQMSVVVKQALANTNEHFSDRIKKIFSVKDVLLFFDLKESEHIEKEIKDTKKRAENANEAEQVSVKRKEEELSQAASIEEVGDYFIKNAGVIILAPYLSPLFKELGLFDGKVFISDEAKERAVYILQYLATGEEEVFEEHEMVLNKILCGVGIGAPLTLSFVISEKEKEECLNLLQAVADNWTALKGTSRTGMRDAFFMRDGILEQQANGWNLKIEKTTIDILLDKLPWGISILQMPWSKEMIFVNW